MIGFWTDLLIERTQSGLAREKAEGVTLGRPTILDKGQRDAMLAELESGKSVAELASNSGTSRQTIIRTRDAVAPA